MRLLLLCENEIVPLIERHVIWENPKMLRNRIAGLNIKIFKHSFSALRNLNSKSNFNFVPYFNYH